MAHYLIACYGERTNLGKFIATLDHLKLKKGEPHIREVKFLDIAVNRKDRKYFEDSLRELETEDYFFEIFPRLEKMRKILQMKSGYEKIPKGNKKEEIRGRLKENVKGLGLKHIYLLPLGRKEDKYKRWSDEFKEAKG